MKYKMFIILETEADSFWKSRDFVWSLIPDKMKPFVKSVSGSEVKRKGILDQAISQLTGK